MENIDFKFIKDLQKDIMGEFDAIMGYSESINNTNNILVRDTLQDIKDEEIHHVGQLMGLLFYLESNFKTHFNQGMEDFENSIIEKGTNNAITQKNPLNQFYKIRE